MTNPKASIKRIRRNNIFYWIGKIAYKLSGWKTEGEFPDLPKSVVIVAHHTSNWDLPVGLMASFIFRMKAYWIGKHTLFRWPIGGLLKRLGGIPVNRNKTENIVDQVVEVFRERSEFMLVVTPEGTRKKVERWKSGFYRIAKEAEVPIVCAYLDYKRKVTGIGPVIFPNEDREEALRKIREFYDKVTAKFPEKRGPVTFSF